MKQIVLLIAEALKEQKYAEAEDMINKELEERVENLKETVKESMLSNIFEAAVSRNVKGLGMMSVSPSNAVIKTGSMKDALTKAPVMAQYIDGSSSRYTAAENADGSITISKGAKTLYDMQYDSADGTLKYEGVFTARDINEFRKTGQMPN